MEETLNLRDVRIFDYDENRNAILNKKETAIAQGKQALIKQAFQDWIWKDPERRERLTRLYNDKFNSIRPREYDGSHINFAGINPEITLRPHQINAIAHILYGGNTLLAHVVGAGKTWEMVAAAQESKRLGLCHKSLFVVPNHLTEQWASEYLQLYPAANILVATRKDFEAKNRKRFCGRIATGDYDAVILGHSQFEKIPMSLERQTSILEQQKEELVLGIADLKRNHGERFNIYDDLRDKLIAKGIPAEEIAYIHTANTEVQKKELFGKVRSGQIRVLLGSTQKMGAGTNVQQRLIALHHLDCPWRPSDLQQREGRIIRQGNENEEVDIYTYVTEGTFDSYLYQMVENKQKFVGQIMTSKSPARSAEDVDETALSYAEVKALCAGDPHIKEKMDLDVEVQRLKLLKSNHLSQKYALEDQIIKYLPQTVASLEQRMEGYTSDVNRLNENTHPNQDGFSPMEVEGTVYAVLHRDGKPRIMDKGGLQKSAFHVPRALYNCCLLLQGKPIFGKGGEV